MGVRLGDPYADLMAFVRTEVSSSFEKLNYQFLRFYRELKRNHICMNLDKKESCPNNASFLSDVQTLLDIILLDDQ